MKNLSLLLLAFILSVQGIAKAGQQDKPNFPMSYGEIHNSPLSYLASDNLDAAYTLLRKRQLNEASEAFEAEAKQNNKNLTAYVGWLQAKPEVLTSEMKRLEALAQRDGRDAVTLFKLGTVRVYRYKSLTNSQITALLSHKKDPRADLISGKNLLQKAWSESAEPVIGLMLIEACVYLSDQEMGRKVSQALVQKLAGSDAYASYTKAERGKWYDNPPSTRLTPESNRKPLAGVLMSIWTEAGAKARQGRVVNGQIVWEEWQSPTKDQDRKANYIDTWIKRLKNSQVVNR